MEKKKLLFIVPAFFTDRPQAIRFRNIVKYLPEEFEIHIVFPSFREQYKKHKSGITIHEYPGNSLGMFVNPFYYPYIKVIYYKKNHLTYEKNLLEAMAAGRGPDIFMLHHTWMPRYENKVYVAPQEIILLRDFQESG